MELEYTTTLPGTGLEVTCVFDYTPFQPAHISGAPEDCYPSEGGEVYLAEALVAEEDLLPFLNQAAINYLTDLCERWARKAQDSGEL